MQEIFIESKRVNEKTLLSKVKAPPKVRKYLNSTELFVHYDEEITQEESILNIPLISILLPLSWLTDIDITVDSIDKRYYESMMLLRNEMNRIYPYKPFKAKINVKNLVENRVNAQGSALLFSGGVDSTYSLINNLEKKPRLIMIWGIDMHIYPQYSDHWNELNKIYSKIADSLDLEFNMVKTNSSAIIDMRKISHAYHNVLCSGSFGPKIAHTLRFMPLVSPLSINRFANCLVAASIYPHFPFNKWSIGTIPSTDEKIVWADLTTTHDGFIPRIEKVKVISDFIKNNHYILKVCLRPEVNCSKCSKCYRTIISLLIYGVDPNSCGFTVTKETFDDMKIHFKKPPQHEIFVPHFLKPMQNMISDENLDLIPGADDFLRWFRDIDLEAEIKSRWKYRRIYDMLPYSLASPYSWILNKGGINIHPNSYIEARTPENTNEKYSISSK